MSYALFLLHRIIDHVLLNEAILKWSVTANGKLCSATQVLQDKVQHNVATQKL